MPLCRPLMSRSPHPAHRSFPDQDEGPQPRLSSARPGRPSTWTLQEIGDLFCVGTSYLFGARGNGGLEGVGNDPIERKSFKLCPVTLTNPDRPGALAPPQNVDRAKAPERASALPTPPSPGPWQLPAPSQVQGFTSPPSPTALRGYFNPEVGAGRRSSPTGSRSSAAADAVSENSLALAVPVGGGWDGVSEVGGSERGEGVSEGR
ncbi:hypothetical protein BDK51DRAFT_38711 [Blyttiomyces helicus]|uniref:Uncharacterized protein n=1 Tax=Blyttiomyces helicus TaxID=388810 RepID=A0A4P9W8T4_9FUNG|nr:hypothetical protein BDK51DRAFT_38711 [Blyttiomyces helicus]|eukprot:RKO87498.1 hypothetical protein BDK51DRAFT_38711 [Blyttiomyces helicus]